ncbi:MAG TPA: GNAT family N-acetyltransferase [Streptosporangiaceae bacterium]|nr:GNAT family N-acetyltransferase [Streptosporangiaceae bacterium]
MDRPPVRIRPYRPADIDALYQICLLTGDRGQDATSLYRDPKLLGHCFAAPYGLFEPSLAFVAEDTSGVAGYVLGALDSQAFEKRLESSWWPRLRARYPEPPPGLAVQQRTPAEQLAQFIHHPGRTPDDLAAAYPSHLHIDLLPRLQARGYGRQLIQTLTTALRDRGSSGVHLHVTPGNDRAASFYRHIGFTQIPATDTHLFVMDFRNAG